MGLLLQNSCYLARGRLIKAAMYENSIAAEIPAEVAFKPPDNTPKSPDSSVAFMTPLASEYPNPVNGIVAPHLANFTIGSYNPKEVNIAPVHTYITKILAGVSLVLSIKIWPITHIRPPTQNALIYDIVFHIHLLDFLRNSQYSLKRTQEAFDIVNLSIFSNHYS